ncbi:hypothetical protein ABE444_03620 [Brevundimonas pondensis]|uniref:Uncharacterized protein n=1 Tax=Brevundimonas pondensis TaxID=2774189 RepID=A0ABX7SHE4_9CAUL|nr:hypothetical protein [Brevundimonas pondensis]QTC86423.1 hypothetical protein IFE19_09595 [Brevundimonas pondensis]
MDELKRSDPNAIPPTGPSGRRVEERIIVERESNVALWWVVGILLAAVVFGLIYVLTRPDGGMTEADLRTAQAEAAAESARQSAETAIAQNQINSSRDSVAIAQAQSATARSEALRAAAEARVAEARAAAPVVVERPAPSTPPANDPAVVTSTTPQPQN